MEPDVRLKQAKRRLSRLQETSKRPGAPAQSQIGWSSGASTTLAPPTSYPAATQYAPATNWVTKSPAQTMSSGTTSPDKRLRDVEARLQDVLKENLRLQSQLKNQMKQMADQETWLEDRARASQGELQRAQKAANSFADRARQEAGKGGAPAANWGLYPRDIKSQAQPSKDQNIVQDYPKGSATQEQNRLRSLEQRLEALLNEVELLRKELHSPPSKGPGK
jgi:hypothetical protein